MLPGFCKITRTMGTPTKKSDRAVGQKKSEHGFLMIGGKRLEIIRHGPAPEDAPTLVFLHEGLGCAAMWRDFPARLAAATGCGALVYSRLGYGRSDPCVLPRPISFMHDEALRVLPELVAAAGIRECILIGHSDGGSIAIIYAGGTAAAPVRGLIAEAAHVFSEAITSRQAQSAREAYLRGDLRARLRRYHGPNVDGAFWGWNDVWLHPDFVNWNLEQYLPHIKVPMLVIQGEDDEYGTAAQVQAIAAGAGAGAEVLMLPACGHAPHQDREPAVFQAMKNFILQVFNG